MSAADSLPPPRNALDSADIQEPLIGMASKLLLSVVVPVYNERNTIQAILEKIKAAKLPPGCHKEIIVVDDSSKDGTTELLRELQQKDSSVKIFFHDVNRGKGGALRTGFAQTSGDYVIVQDADLEYDPDEYSLLLEPVLDKKADVVYGSRFDGHRGRRILYFWHSLGNAFLTTLSNMLSDLNLSDMETCFKLVRGDLIRNIDLQESRFGIEPEITAKLAALARKGEITIYEVGISYYGRTYEEGKKIGWKDGVSALWCILKYNTSMLAYVLRYSLAGAVIFSFQLSVLFFLTEGLKLRGLYWENIAHTISIELGLLFSYFVHSGFTWEERGNHRKLSSFIRFHLVSLGSLAIRAAIFYFLSLTGMVYVLNAIIGIGVTVLLNFLGYDRIVFRAIGSAKRYAD